MNQKLIVCYLSKDDTFTQDSRTGYRFRWGNTRGKEGGLYVREFDNRDRLIWSKSYRRWISVETTIGKDKKGKA